MDRTEILLSGRTFIWDGKRWYDALSFLTPPKSVIHRLNALLEKQLAQKDVNASSVDELLELARRARDALQLVRAESLCRRALKLDPDHLGALSILCSILRALKQPEQALKETRAFREAGYQPLLVSRAAAFCDLEMWSQAKREIGRALALGKSESAFLVVERIKRVKPELYSWDTRTSNSVGNKISRQANDLSHSLYPSKKKENSCANNSTPSSVVRTDYRKNRALYESIVDCVKRYSGELTRSAVAKILCGSNSKRIQNYRNDQLFDSFGHLSRTEITIHIDFLIVSGILRLQAGTLVPGIHTKAHA
jgi:hypothetical protein